MSSSRRRAVGPDLVGPVTMNLVGIAIVLAAWAGASGQESLGPQLPYLNLGVAGAVIAAAGNVLYLIGFRGLVHARLDDLQIDERTRS